MSREPAPPPRPTAPPSTAPAPTAHAAPAPPGPAGMSGLRVAVFGFDLAEPAQIRRIRALAALGCEVSSFCQRRAGSPAFQPDWPNVELGEVRHRDIRGRALGLGAAIGRAARGWRTIAQADLIVARNLDLALIAVAARSIAGLRARLAGRGRRAAPLVYECLDIHDLLTAPGLKGRLARAAERRVLARAALLVVSSPGFLEHHFGPVQGWTGPVALVENKLWLGPDPALWPERPRAEAAQEGRGATGTATSPDGPDGPDGPPAGQATADGIAAGGAPGAGDAPPPASGRAAAPPRLLPARPLPASAAAGARAPITLGLVGSIRCQASVDLMFATARLMGDRLRLRFSGALHDHALSGFHAALAACPTAEWTGPYAYPAGLVAAYRGCDLVWAQDLWQRGTNSDWLLPNRIYEASWCGCPSVGVAGTFTGRRILAEGLGHVIAEPSAAALAGLLEGFAPGALRADRARLLARPATDFVQTPAELGAMLAPALRPGAEARPGRRAPAPKPLSAGGKGC